MIQGGEVRYVVYIGGVQQAQAGLNQMEQSANRAERGITNLNGALRSMASSVGVSSTAIDAASRSLSSLEGGLRTVGITLGAQALLRFGKDAVQSAADYEAAMKRIIFSSENMSEGQKNLAFIRSEVDKFKIPLQEATDDYGKFLAMLAGSDIAGDQVRELHDQILTIAKIKGLDAGQLSAGVMNLGKMLEAGSMDARHLRPLEMQLSGIGQYIARLMGTTVHGLSVMRNKGMLAAADPKVLLEAVKMQAADLGKYLPESLTTIQSGINEVSNAWLDFKNSLVLSNKSELVGLFDVLKDGIGYLKEHRTEIVEFGHVLVGLAKAWFMYSAVTKIAAMATVATSAVTTATSAVVAHNAALTTEAELVAALAVEYDALVVSMSGFYGAEKAAFMATAANSFNLRPNMAGVAAAGAAGAAGAGAAITGAISSAILPVAVMYFGGEALNALIPQAENGYKFDWKDIFTRVGRFQMMESYFGESDRDRLRADKPQTSSLNPNMSWGYMAGALPGYSKGYLSKYGVADPAAAQAAGKIKPPTDHVTGQRVVTYNISIKEINGIKENTVNEGGKMNEEDFAERMKQVILSTLRDSHIDYR